MGGWAFNCRRLQPTERATKKLRALAQSFWLKPGESGDFAVRCLKATAIRVLVIRRFALTAGRGESIDQILSDGERRTTFKVLSLEHLDEFAVLKEADRR